MCTHQRFVRNKYTGQSILVKCGHCLACQQQKASRRTSRIKMHNPVGYSCYFITLTYANDFIPRVTYDDFYNTDLLHLPIRRSCRATRRTSDFNYHFDDTEEVLGTVFIDDRVSYPAPPHLRGRSDSFGVIYYKDVQHFYARLRQNLRRRHNVKLPLSYFTCAEYGPTTFRPHFHLLVWFPTGLTLEFVRSAVLEAWPFTYSRASGIDVERAIDAAGYVSSYVNRGAAFPALLSARCFRPKHSYSKRFGCNEDLFTLSEILARAERGDFTYTRQTYCDGAPVTLSLLLPAYVYGRFFPYVEGYSRFTLSERFDCLRAPSSYRQIAPRYSFSSDVVHKVIVRLNNAFSRYCADLGVVPSFAVAEQYARDYEMVRNARARTILRMFYDNAQHEPEMQRYDNIVSFWYRPFIAPTLFKFSDGGFYINANDFDLNVAQTAYYEKMFETRMKQRKVAEIVLDEQVYNAVYDLKFDN